MPRAVVGHLPHLEACVLTAYKYPDILETKLLAEASRRRNVAQSLPAAIRKTTLLACVLRTLVHIKAVRAGCSGSLARMPCDSHDCETRFGTQVVSIERVVRAALQE